MTSMPLPRATDTIEPAGAHAPRFGGILWRLARATSSLTLPLAGKPWNPIFGVIEHVGRRSGRHFRTPVAVRRDGHGFVISLAFGAHVDWYRNVAAAGGCTIKWRGDSYPVGAPQLIDASTGRAAFHPIQRALLGLGRIDGYIRLADTA
jgi:deazaflavin-dependent oxidoreductase (nitroreductase family)